VLLEDKRACECVDTFYIRAKHISLSLFFFLISIFNLPTSLQFRYSPTKPNPTQLRREKNKGKRKKKKEKDPIKPSNNKKAYIHFVFPLPF
jgi:hypothetical protein